ncbi:peptidoglycan-binding domain-containing protein [Streptosporangium roseum]|uniref:Peptidoglycan binding domain-containing protein n=1 Tax=Streptosporangium roseum (strain ATCC 12428 / DSM 43021 / JCM 3005 / KCTC 9067 / NCIMB 10171 / NRRL 2505 / NI 9100) TaxID=479432 RepID=D2AXB1_STRRD|nr:peptidoglycan-binding domain-containing protein [Streptosporangium roseum]ACZ90838.1 peptidoglycan binding domain-containing protein [Streptosporangium roseum DSM 43021]
MRRSRVLALVVAGVLVIAGAGWAVGSRLRSPADEASARRPPKPSLVTAPVELRRLTSTVTVSGTLTYGSPLPVTLAGTVGGAGGNGGAGGAGGTPQRVTTAPKPGPIRAGQVLMQVNGRPVFAMEGKKPMYRPLVPGTEGDDVKQFQRALRVKVTGVFDAATVAAVKRWYAKRGYKAQEPDLESRKTLQQLRQAVQTAKEILAADRKALDEGVDVRPLRIRLDNARRDLRSAEKALEEAPEITPEQETQLAALRRAVRAAEEQVLAAEQALAEAVRPAPTPTTTPPTTPAPTPAPMPSAVDTSLLEMKLANTRQDLYEAQQAVAAYEEQIRVERDKRLEELHKGVRTAKEAEATAAQALGRARKVSPLRMKVAHSKGNLADAHTMLAEFLKTYGVSVPAGEIVFLPTLPARIDKAEVKPGDTIEGKVATVTSSAFAVTGSVDAKEAKLLRPGQEASMETMDGTQLPATLTATGEEARVSPAEGEEGEKDDGSDTGSVPVLLTPGSAKGLKSLVGSPMTVRISVGSTEGEVLAVPVSAVVTSADGRPRVRVALDGDRTREVEVRTGLTADGDVEVTPVRAGELEEGDRVVVSDV